MHLTFKDNDAIIISTIINKLQHISRNIRFLMSEVGKIMTFTFTSYKSSKGTFSVLKCIKTYIGSNMGNNQLHALILVHIRKNILNNIN